MVHNLYKCAGGYARKYLVEDAELSGSDEGKWYTSYISVPEAMPEKTGDSKPLCEIDLKIDAFAPETMFQHFHNEEAEWCSSDPSYPEDVDLEEGYLIEEAELSGNDAGKWCTTYLSVPEHVPERLAIPNQLVKQTMSISSLKHAIDKVEWVHQPTLRPDADLHYE
jgi:hypothetical protein